MPEALTPDQIAHYNELGYLVLPGHVPDAQLHAIRGEIARFTDMAAGMTASDHRIDLEDSHTPDNPRIRRVKLPHTQSAPLNTLLRSDMVLAPVRDLLGPDLRLHTTKLNMKSAGYGAAVEWHQDWAFYPCTNDDVLAVGLLIDDMSVENGPLLVFPGTHRGPTLDHHDNGCFAGAIDVDACGLNPADAVPLTGPAGSLTFHHVRIVHGSAVNRSDRDRRIVFFEMMAADAFPIYGKETMPTWEEFEANMLCGNATLTPRLVPAPIRVPQPLPSTTGSIYEIQKARRKRAFDPAS